MMVAASDRANGTPVGRSRIWRMSAPSGAPLGAIPTETITNHN